MLLPRSLRESLVDDLDEYLDAVGSSPDTEALAAYVIEKLEEYGEESGEDDVLVDLEESGQLEDPLQDTLEGEFASNEELEFTGEEIVTLLEQACGIEWDASLDEDDEDDEDDDDLL